LAQAAQQNNRTTSLAMDAVSPLTAVSAPPVQQRLSDIAYERIKHDIIRCALAPGEEVTEARLGVRLGLGKAPVRAALMRLSQEGLIRALPRRGYLVAPVTLRDVQDIFQFRMLLEPEAARLAAGRVQGDRLRQLDAVCRAGYVPGDRESEADFLRANRDFHVTIAEASGNARLTTTLAGLLDEMERLLHLGLALRNRTEEMQHEHKTLVDALIRGDGDAAAGIAAEQVDASRKMVMDAILSSPLALEVSIRQA
jgi:DNA-binding GntR family transcriptional regulator